MKKTYKISNGLAFFEQKDLQMLREKAAEGWMVESFKGGLYTFTKSGPKDVIFSIDYHELTPEDEEEYCELFAAAGWTHVYSHTGIHLFKAVPGTPPIYSDAASKTDQVKRSAKPVYIVTIAALLFTIITLAFMKLAEGSLHQAGKIGFFISIVLFIPMIMTSMALFIQLLKVNKSSKN
ncbi:DUF2812 domain-containing protein [Cytobacillus firmus]|uniref:DUF2812 domain-containing protein n=1 Tax=Cytobacillus firmus TaxID=1399 RepID=UPI0021619275|nr:DUF2812 domain-containing protein [Cytobacillus firmus]MCS0670283.1 DUF2812 domain-containing protein [Cytobacillus firmus]